MQIKRIAKKSLGQNFLRSKVIVSRIAGAAKILPGETVLEIGPGKGILTKALLETGAKVVAVEMDRDLIPSLEEKFSEEIAKGKLKIIQGDILDPNLKLDLASYKLVANIPYYITGAIIRKFLEEKNKPNSMVILVQKEVARRIVASDHKESILSLSVKAYGTPKYIETVKKNMFAPAPSVDSAVLLIEGISDKFFRENNIQEEKFFEVIKAGFAQKRKVVSGNLSKVYAKDFGREKVLKALEEAGVPQTARAEDIDLSSWLKILTKLS